MLRLLQSIKCQQFVTDLKIFVLAGLLVFANVFSAIEKFASPRLKYGWKLFVIRVTKSYYRIYAGLLMGGILAANAYKQFLSHCALVVRCFCAFWYGFMLGLSASYRAEQYNIRNSALKTI